MREIKTLNKEEFIKFHEDITEGELKTIWYNDHINPKTADYAMPIDLFYTEKIIPCFLIGVDEIKMFNHPHIFKNSNIQEIKRGLLEKIYGYLIDDYATEIYTDDFSEELEQRSKLNNVVS